MKKIIYSLLGLGILLVGCGSGDSSSKSFDESKNINVYTRDASSGTREAFEKFVGFKDELTDSALETTGNGDMATKVGNDTYGIGYVSMTTEFDKNNLKKLTYNGVEPTEENVINGTYELARPFSYVSRATGDFGDSDKELLVAAFLDYLNNSIEGKDAIESAGGIVDMTGAKPWSELSQNHPVVLKDNSGIVIRLVGSTSVEDTITEAYQSFAPTAGNVVFEADLTGSSDGYKRVLGSEKDSAVKGDIGFASRNFDSEENVTTAAESGAYARDGIVIVVSMDNTFVSEITDAQAYDVFTGAITTWDGLK